jgi:CheY-like chemotaxis protein
VGFGGARRRQSAALLVCLYRPMAGWWLELTASGLTALVAQPVSASEPWPWPVTSVFALTVVLVMVGLRAPRRVLIELWLLLGVISAATWLAVPDRRDWRGLSTTIVVSAVALLLADAVRGRDEARRRLVEQEQVSETERARRLLLEERARIARELHDVVAHHMSVIAIQAEAAPHRVPDPPEELAAATPWPPSCPTARRGQPMIRVLIADDQAMVREGLAVLLNAKADIEVAAEAADGQEAVRKAAEARPDVVLMDVRMPVMNGLQATRLIVGGGAPAPKVLVLTTFDLDEYVYEALRAGASGFLLKDSSGQQLAEAVRVVAAGDALLAPR